MGIDDFRLGKRWRLESELTTLKGLPRTYLKRDDELSYGVSGSKWRKLASLIPWLSSQAPKVSWLVGGINSNSVAAAAQQFREANLPFRILATPARQWRANGILTKAILAPSELKYVQRSGQAATIAALRRLANDDEIILVEEGLDHEAAYPGAASLASDLHRNEADLGQRFAHVVMDAGTGISAACLMVGDLLAGRQRQYHIVLIAGDEAYFRQQLGKVAIHLGADSLDISALNISFYRPLVGRAFGSTPAAVWTTIRAVAHREGVILDPIYTAKTYAVLEAIAPTLSGATVMVHTGGAGGATYTTRGMPLHQEP